MLGVLLSGITSAGRIEAYAAAFKGGQSSFEYKNYPEPGKYLDDLRHRMSDVYGNLADGIYNSRTIPIPGIIRTYTEEGGKKRKSKQFVPQGLCRAGNYILITAYDFKKEHNSVIYAIDTEKDTLVSTLTMPNKYHAGGISFDGTNIWMTGDTSDSYKGEPFVQYMTYDTLLGHVDEPLSEVSKNELSGRVYIKNRPSFLECDNGTLWVGTFAGKKDTAEGYMNGYKIITGEDGSVRLNTMMYSMITGIDSSAQGADISGDDLYVSSSYNGFSRRIKSSYVTRYDLGPVDSRPVNYKVQNREVSRVEVPKMNEEILVEDGAVHINFEAAAEYYRLAVIKTDRILAVEESVWR